MAIVRALGASAGGSSVPICRSRRAGAGRQSPPLAHACRVAPAQRESSAWADWGMTFGSSDSTVRE
jgi:hypothetical protein